ncbi:MAG: PQQ-binding-like beta-propeller repeat protein [Thermoplasmatales archaeon]|nr:MAG: PQQ-binding-like beta-propeller repeat protein [Thermoplasmatales archaeon]
MKKILSFSIIILFVLAGLGAVGIFNNKTVGNFYESEFKGLFDDVSAYRYQTALYSTSEGNQENHYEEELQSTEGNRDYPIGEIIWQYQIPPATFNSAKGIRPIPDINGDGIDDVVIGSEDHYVRCISGASTGTGVVLWEHDAGWVEYQKDLIVTDDLDGDDYNDVVVGTCGGARLIRAISGETGLEIWTHDTHEYGDGGWVYQVDCSYDYNGDDIPDVLATTGGTATGPRRVYCLDGEDGTKIWECPLGSPRGPGFSVIGIEDFTGDGQPDVLAGASNSGETIGYAYGINGATGSITWTFTAAGSSVWALEQIDDVSGDGINDVIIGDFGGNIYGLDATTGNVEYSNSLGSAIITRFAKLNDVNGDGHPDIVPAHSTTHVTQVIDGYTGSIIWSHPVADQPWNVARIADISGDAIDDVLVGTLFNNNYCYFLNGVNGSELFSTPYPEAVDAIGAVSDLVNDGSMEMVAGGRYGKVVCYSGGLNSSYNPVTLTADFTADLTEGTAPLTVHFTDLSIAENTSITSWKWDFENDGIIDSEEPNPVWTYTEDGIYTVSLTVSDGTISDIEIKVDYINVLPIEFSIENTTGGLFKVGAVINNNGETEVTDLSWNIKLSGGFILLGRDTSGENVSIPPGGQETISSSIILGLGQTTVAFSAEIPDGPSDTRQRDAFVLLFFIKFKPGGGL